jgi:hypothetical protein
LLRGSLLLPEGGEGRVGHITPAPGPPEIHDGRQVWQLFAHLGHGCVTDRQLMVLSQRFDGRHRRLQVAGNLGRGLGSRVGNAERVQREREGLQEAPIAGVRRFPAATSACRAATNLVASGASCSASGRSW